MLPHKHMIYRRETWMRWTSVRRNVRMVGTASSEHERMPYEEVVGL